jgi:octaprenyl-diphosphate synthase
MERLTATTNIVCRGELHQQVAERQADLTEAEYERIVYGKTAALTELAGECGAWGRDPRFAAAGAAYGRACGIAFQIVDDCLDLSGDAQKVGKTLATDLERGRVTLPIIRALAATPATGRPAAERLLLHAQGPDEVARARAYVLDRGGLDSAIATARERVADAKRALAPLPAGAATSHLHDLADFIVARDF